jgi:hypothetical protein
MIKSLSAGHIEYKNGASSSSIVRSSDTSKALLSSSVPDLELNRFVIHIHIPGPKLNADRKIVISFKAFVSEL